MSGMCYNKSMKERLGITLGVGVALLMFGGCNITNALEKETDFVVDIDPQAMLVVPAEPVVLSIAPSENGTFDKASFDVYASTNSKNGYTLTIQTNKTQLESTYADANTGIAPKIPAMSYVGGGMTEDEFSASSDSQNVLNHWGISIDDTDSFNPVQNSRVVKTTATAASNDKTTVNVAAKVNTDVAFGNYATTINFMLTPNINNDPRGVSGGSIDTPSGNGGSYRANTLGRSYEIYYHDVLQKSIYVKDDTTPEGYHALRDGEDTTGKGLYFAMQDMTSEICNRVKTVPDQLQVMDLRDAKVYWIAKLADGKCWMTQNLDLNLSTNVTLTPANTDIRRNWTPSFTTLNYDGKIVNSTYIYEWANDYSNNSIPYSLDMGDWYWIGNWDDNGNNTWYYSTTDYFFEGQVGSPAKFKYKEPFTGNGEHGHVGNYYSYGAAVAMNDAGTLENVDPDQSICPAHWTLPKYADYSNDSENNYVYNLMQAHSVDTSNDRSTTAAPFYFVRAGYADSSFSNTGYNGYYWTSHSSSSSSAYYYYHSSSSFYAQGSTLSKYYRASVRCVAR